MNGTHYRAVATVLLAGLATGCGSSSTPTTGDGGMPPTDGSRADQAAVAPSFEGSYHGRYLGKTSGGAALQGSFTLELLPGLKLKVAVDVDGKKYTYSDGAVTAPDGKSQKASAPVQRKSDQELTLTAQASLTLPTGGQPVTETIDVTGNFTFDKGQAVGKGTWKTSVGSTGTWTAYQRKPECTKVCQFYLGCGFQGPKNVDECISGCSDPAFAPIIACLSSAAATCQAAKTCVEGTPGALEKAYVSLRGDDAKDGASAATAKKTVGAALKAVKAGGQVLVEAGTYGECLSITKAVSLRGSYDASFSAADPVVRPSILDGKQQCRLLETISIGGPLAVEIDGFVFENGEPKPGMSGLNGGCIWAKMVDLTLSRCVVRNCHAPDHGGGLAGYQGSITISDSSFTGNKADGNAGGGIHLSEAKFKIANTQLTNNQGVNVGGGLNAWKGAGRIESCVVTGNVAKASGGGMSVSAGPGGDSKAAFVIKGTKVQGNRPDNVAGEFTDEGGNSL